ncbi:hypothetical protein SAMN03159332_5420 [Paenibacillus sp. 276b]|nr:hypothetical protein SAMN03159332_5420 [Paenibacillus sp. 276b]
MGFTSESWSSGSFCGMNPSVMLPKKADIEFAVTTATPTLLRHTRSLPPMMTPTLIIPNIHTITSIMTVILFRDLITITVAIVEPATTVVEIVAVGTVAAVVEIRITPQTKKRAVSDIVRTQFGTALSCFPAPEY